MKTLRIAKLGKNALTSTDPNDFIFAPDWNTPNIIKEGTKSSSLSTTASAEAFTEVAHGLNYTPFIFGFCKFADNRVGLVGSKASGVDFSFSSMRVNATNVRFGYINDSGGNYTPTFKYLATEIPLAGTPSIDNPGGRRLVIAKDGFNALTELNPDNKVFDSQFGTLKYFHEDVTTVSVPSDTPAPNVTSVYEEVLYTHDLDYYPFFGGSGEFADNSGKFYIMPLSFGDAGFLGYDMLYTTKTQLIFRSERTNVFGFENGNYDIDVFWKIYSKDLKL